MSETEKDLSLTAIREQAVKVMGVMHQIGLLDPMQNGMDGTDTIEAIIAYANRFTGEAFGTAFGYRNVELVFTIQMTDVSTNGATMHMTPVITHVKASHYPLPCQGMDYPAIERLCNEAIQKVLVSSNV